MGEITRDELSKQLREDIVYNSDKIAKPAEVEIHGRTLINELGRYGNAIYKKFGAGDTHGTLTYESDTFVLTNAGENAWTTTLYTDHVFTKGKYYICLGDIYLESGDSAYVNITCTTTDQNRSQYLITEKNKWITSWHSILIGDAGNGHPKPYFAFVLRGTNVRAKFKNNRIYEIDKATHDKLATMTRDEVAKMFPYVDDIKCVVNPYIESKENLINPNSYYIGSYFGDKELWYQAVLSDTKFVCNADHITLEPGTYYFDADFNGDDIFIYSHYGNSHDEALYQQARLGRVEIKETCKFIIAMTNLNKPDNSGAKEILAKLTSGEYRITLTKGSEPKKFEDCHNSRIMFETKLHEGETISRRNDGTYVKNNKVIDMVIDESFLAVPSPLTDCKVLIFPSITYPTNSATDTTIDKTQFKMVAYDGKILKHANNGDEWGLDTTHFHFGGAGNGSTNMLHLKIPNILSGWGPAYTPTQEEIKAFLLGWRMYKRGASGTMLYDGVESTGAKAWVKLWCGVGNKATGADLGVDYVDASNKIDGICPTTINDQGYTYYRLIYGNTYSINEEIQVHGSLNIKDGLVINVSSGLVLSESVGTQLHTDGLHYINGSYSLTDNRLQRTIAVYDDNFVYTPINIVNTNVFSHITKGSGIATYTNKNDNEPMYCDYLIYEADTVTSYDYKISTPQITKELIEKVVEELSNTNTKTSIENTNLKNKIESMSEIGNPNLLVNGDFQIWQRGTTFSKLGSVYTADRWRVGGSEVAVSKSSISGANITYDRSVGGDSYIVQWLEVNPNFVKGKSFTVSAKIDGKVYSMSAKLSPTVWAIQGIETPVGRLYFQNAIDGSYECICCGIYFTKTVSFNLEWIKLEMGEHPTPFVSRTYAEELSRCQRYYQKLYSYIGWGYTHGPYSVLWRKINGIMRKVPSVNLVGNFYFRTMNSQTNAYIDYVAPAADFRVAISSYPINDSFTFFVYTDKQAQPARGFLCSFGPSTISDYVALDAEIY